MVFYVPQGTDNPCVHQVAAHLYLLTGGQTGNAGSFSSAMAGVQIPLALHNHTVNKLSE